MQMSVKGAGVAGFVTTRALVACHFVTVIVLGTLMFEISKVVVYGLARLMDRIFVQHELEL